jgi:hypothetical protein
VSEKLGNVQHELKGAVFGSEGDYLFVSGKINGMGVQYVYDTLRKIWHRHGDERAAGYIRYSDATLAAITSENKVSLCTLYKGIPAEPGVTITDKNRVAKWEAVSSAISYYTTRRKYVSKICLDMSCDEDAELFLSYDGGEWKQQAYICPHERMTKDIFVPIRRCHFFSIKLSGSGNMALFNITKLHEEANENG